MQYVLLLGCLLGLVAGCEQPAAPAQATAPVVPGPARSVVIPEGAVRGDFDGDGTAEYVWLVPPTLDSTGYDCVGACTSHLTSSDPALKPYPLEPAVGGELTTFPHLGLAGATTSVLPRRGSWAAGTATTCSPTGRAVGSSVGEPFSTHCDQWEKDSLALTRDSAHAGHVLVHYTDMAAGNFAVKTKSVPLR